jgi:hypothetical protein
MDGQATAEAAATGRELVVEMSGRLDDARHNAACIHIDTEPMLES